MKFVEEKLRIQQIITDRGRRKQVFFSIVYDWEDVFSDKLGIPIVNAQVPFFENRPRVSALMRKILPRSEMLFTTFKPSLRFEINAQLFSLAYNKGNVIPWFIDFFLRSDQELDGFVHSCKHCPFVLISSREVYEELVSRRGKRNFVHLALSLPDKWLVRDFAQFDKKFDVVMAGRQNSVLEGWLKRYTATHPDVSWIRCVNGEFEYKDNTGKCYPGRTREDYMNVLRMSRSALYSTPGMEEGALRSNGYNQVTPKFLEMLASGCHVLARYSDNPDTRWYGMREMTPSLERYEEFEKRLDDARKIPVDQDKYIRYLEKHLTSARVKQYQEIFGR